MSEIYGPDGRGIADGVDAKSPDGYGQQVHYTNCLDYVLSDERPPAGHHTWDHARVELATLRAELAAAERVESLLDKNSGALDGIAEAMKDEIANAPNAADDPVIRAKIEERVRAIAVVLRWINNFYGRWDEHCRSSAPTVGTLACPLCADNLHVVHFVRHNENGRVDGKCDKAGCLNFKGAG